MDQQAVVDEIVGNIDRPNAVLPKRLSELTWSTDRRHVAKHRVLGAARGAKNAGRIPDTGCRILHIAYRISIIVSRGM